MSHFFSIIKDDNEKSLPENIASHILAKIFNGQLIQGARLIESDIAKELNVSNIPVREAFYILQNHGVIERVPRKGVRIKSLSEEEINDYINALIELYKLGIRYSQDKWTDDTRNTLRGYLEEATQGLNTDDHLAYLYKCEKVVKYIFDVAGNKVFIKFHDQILTITTIYIRTKWDDLENVRHRHSYLENGVNAIIQSKYDAAEAEFEKLVRVGVMI